MSEISHANNTINTHTPSPTSTEQREKTYLPTYIDTVFQRLEARDVEQFYKSYHFWSLQRRIETLHTQIDAVQQAITDNATLMQQVQPSAIALASLAQLQASGVNDLDLLDRMLERGETWLDHIMQLLEHCEELDVIRGDYTQWCEHALEGAYDWIASMDATNTSGTQENEAEASIEISDEQDTELQSPTEAQLLQKLMSDEDATEKIPVLQLFNETEQEVTASSPPTRKTTQPLEQPEQEVIESSLPIRKFTQPLKQEDAAGETEPDSTLLEIGVLTTPEPQIDEMKDIVEMPEEGNEESAVQKVAVNANEVEAPSKDADVQTGEAAPEEIAVNEETSDQANTGLVGMIESPHESQKLQRQTGRQRGFWRFLRSLLAIFYRKRY